MADSTAVEGTVDKLPLRYRIAQAIHDSEHAQDQYDAMRIGRHEWEGCSHQESYLADADAALTALESDEQVLQRLGFERRYYLVGHPGWPDPLSIWPPTEESARAIFAEEGHPNARVIVMWEQGPRVQLLPSPDSEGVTRG